MAFYENNNELENFKQNAYFFLIYWFTQLLQWTHLDRRFFCICLHIRPAACPPIWNRNIPEPRETVASWNWQRRFWRLMPKRVNSRTNWPSLFPKTTHKNQTHTYFRVLNKKKKYKIAKNITANGKVKFVRKK